jgi:hypothetical protein
MPEVQLFLQPRAIHEKAQSETVFGGMMPNFPDETGIANETWERIRKAMATINLERDVIRQAERRIAEATDELGYVLWPRTDPGNQSREHHSLEK